MTKFESIGIDYQNQSNNKAEADRAFAFSCKVCCERGMQIRCDHCMIAVAHEAKIEAIEAYEECKRRKEEAAERQKKEAKSVADEVSEMLRVLFGGDEPPMCSVALCGR